MVKQLALDEMSWAVWRNRVVQALVIFIFNEIKMYPVESDKVHVILTIYHKLAKASYFIEKILDELFVPDVEQECAFLFHFDHVLVTVSSGLEYLACQSRPPGLELQFQRFFAQSNKNFFDVKQPSKVGLKGALSADEFYSSLVGKMTTALSMANVLHLLENAADELTGCLPRIFRIQYLIETL